MEVTIKIIVCILCAVVFFGSSEALLSFIRIYKAGHFVEGTIIGFEKDDSGDGATFPAIVTYTTKQGEKITATSGSSNFIQPTIGKQVWLVYDPLSPSTFHFKKSRTPFLLMLSIFVFGAGAIHLVKQLLDMI